MFGKLSPSTRAEHIPLRKQTAAGQSDPEASLWYQPDYLDAMQQQALFEELIALPHWTQESLIMAGKSVPVPRVVCYIGDAGTGYRYSGVHHQPHPWTRQLDALRHRLCQQVGIAFNSVLLNHYRDGRDHMGWHSDSEAELGEEPIIASLSLGAERRMRFRPRDRHQSIVGHSARSLHLDLAPGSLLIMGERVQSGWQHCLVRTRTACGPRINMTFRRVSSG